MVGAFTEPATSQGLAGFSFLVTDQIHDLRSSLEKIIAPGPHPDAGDLLAISSCRARDETNTITLLHPETGLTEEAGQATIDLSGWEVVVVDDVLYFGFSMFKAVQYPLANGVQTIHTAVLVERNCASLPVHADVRGVILEAAPGHIVECHVPPFEPSFQLVLVSGAKSAAA